MAKLGRFHGIWLSKDTLLLAGAAMLLVGGLAVAWLISKPASRPRPARVVHVADVVPAEPEVPPIRQKAKPEVPPIGQKTKHPMITSASAKVAFRTESVGIPGSDIRVDITLSTKSDAQGNVRGTLHNATPNTIRKIRVFLTTTTWERLYDVPILATTNTTQSLTIFVGEAHREIDGFQALFAWHTTP